MTKMPILMEKKLLQYNLDVQHGEAHTPDEALLYGTGHRFFWCDSHLLKVFMAGNFK